MYFVVYDILMGDKNSRRLVYWRTKCLDDAIFYEIYPQTFNDTFRCDEPFFQAEGRVMSMNL